MDFPHKLKIENFRAKHLASTFVLEKLFHKLGQTPTYSFLGKSCQNGYQRLYFSVRMSADVGLSAEWLEAN